jgi:[acyl-carrier-protein] S-malonyltransferase
MNNLSFGFVFPGQGSQSVGMLEELATAYPVVNRTFAEATDVLGYDLWDLTQNGPSETLNQTIKTQPAMLAAGVSVWRIWQEKGGKTPQIMAGHSLGEYTALVCAGAIEFADAVNLVAERGRFMQEAVAEENGGMAAILGLDDARVNSVCSEAAAGDVVEAVNFNSPKQVVIAGHKVAVERACMLAKEVGAKRCLPIPVSVPSHCTLMKPASERLAQILNDITISTPSISVIHNTNVGLATDAESIREQLAAQLYHPVRWVETVLKMRDKGVSTLLEAGPGKVLTGLTKRIDRSLNGLPLFDNNSLMQALEELNEPEQ